MTASPLASCAPLQRLRGRANLRRQRLRVLVPSDGYHVQQEVVRALRALGHEAYAVDLQAAAQSANSAQHSLASMLAAIARHEPDLVLSINYIGFDRVGWFDRALLELAMPCAIWLVDSPLFFAMGLLRHRAPQTHLFAWDRSHARALAQHLQQPVHHLPLAAEPERFVSARARQADDALPLTFVGSSLVPLARKWRARLEDHELPLAEAMAARLLADRHALHALCPSPQAPIDRNVVQVAYANCLASGQLRAQLLACVPPEDLYVFGDDGWQRKLPRATAMGEVAYGASLGAVYRRSAINLNVTILQMPEGVNQRVFDVPCAGGFLLTDAQSELSSLFEVGREAISFADGREMAAHCAYFLARPKERAAIAAAARQRIAAEHRYTHRMDRLIARMREACAGVGPLSTLPPAGARTPSAWPSTLPL